MPPPDSAETFAYDVFISYSHKDEVWVEKTLLPRLEAAGLKVCIDFRDFVAGKPALFNMEDAVKNSRHTLLVLTEEWVASEWSTFEAILVRTKDPAGLQRRTIPLRLKPCEPSDAISMLTWVDFTRLDREAIAWRQLLTALGAPPPQEAPAPTTPANWHLVHPYPMPPNFTGRDAERALLSDWLEQDAAHPLFVLRALGGFGKSALTWHWLTHDVVAARWPQVVWWSFYEPNSSFESFLSATLAYLGVDPKPLPSPRQQADELLHRLARPGLLLVLDGFERACRAFSSMSATYQGDTLLPLPPGGEGRGEGFLDCISPHAEHFLRNLATLPGLRSKVLMTTRLTPRILFIRSDLLQGCREQELRQLQPADAVLFFRSQGVRGSRTEIEAACAPYGYHPLSLCLLAGLVVKDLRQPGDIGVTKRLDIAGDLVQRQHHVLEQAYTSLPLARQQLLSRIACFRSPVSYETLKALANTDEEADAPDTSDAALRDLLERGLLQRDTRSQRFDLHPIVRRYAYDRLAGQQRLAAHRQLRIYFAAIEMPAKVQTLDELTPVIELYHHMVNAGQYDDAVKLFYDRINKATYYQFGAYQLRIELLRALFPDGEEKLPRLTDENVHAWKLNSLANSYGLSGQPRRAVSLFERQISIREKQGDKKNLAIDLGNLASMAQIHIGALQAAEVNLRRSIELCREIEDAFHEASGHMELGRLLSYRGVWAEAEAELSESSRYDKQTNEVQGLCVSETCRALRELLLARSSVRAQGLAPLPAALQFARRALELADETARDSRFVYTVRDYVHAHWLLGAAQRAEGDRDVAERHLNEALTRCRSINLVEVEANILLDLARLRHDQGQRAEALRLAEEAQIITERSGYVLQGADVQLLLAELALADGERAKALVYARTARQLATCDGPPDYTYKVAYDEAGALLAQLGENA